MSERIVAIYPGTFDPITNGHIDIILRGHRIVDELVIAVSTSRHKKPMFSVSERCKMIEMYISQYNLSGNVRVERFDGLLVNFATKMGADLIIRGLRVISDFEYEFQMSCMNSRLNDKIETIFLPASEGNQFISSSMVKEVASLGGDITPFVIPGVASKVYDLYKHE